MPNLLTQRRIFRPFRPDQISGLALWFDAADASTVTTDGSGNVTAWADKSGNARNASQDTAGLRPTYSNNVVRSVNGQRVSLASRLNVSGDFAIFAVASNAAVIFTLLDTSSTSPTTTTNFKAFYFSNWPPAGFSTNLVTGGSNPNMLATTFSGIGLLRLQRTGTDGVFSLNSTLTRRTFNSTALEIDDIVGSRQTNLNSDTGMREVIVFTRALSDSEAGLVSSYLKAKWGTP